jgi:hypothetical protein
MSDIPLTVQSAGPAGVTPTRTAIATGNTYQVRNSGRVALLFEKTGGGDATITITTPATLGGLAVADPTITVPATTGDITAAKFPPAIYNDGNGDLNFTTDEGTGLTCAVLAI